MSTRKEYFFKDDNTPILKPTSRGKIRHPNTRDLSKMLGVSDPVLLDFLYQTFNWNPETRMKPQQALEHEWIQQDFPRHLFQSN